jgi:hypothetical protein
MSFAAYFDNDLDNDGEVASNQGWVDFIDWVETLPTRGSRRLRDLASESWTTDPAALEKELKQQFSKCVDAASARAVVEALLALLKTRPKNASRIVVWDGCNPVFEDESDDDDLMDDFDNPISDLLDDVLDQCMDAGAAVGDNKYDEAETLIKAMQAKLKKIAKDVARKASEQRARDSMPKKTAKKGAKRRK